MTSAFVSQLNQSSLRGVWLVILTIATAIGLSAAPTVTTSPPRNVVTPGESVSLVVTASGNGALTYQWLHKGKTVSGATGSSLVIANAAYADSGWYVCDVTDSGGTQRSKPFFVVVAPSKIQIRAMGYPYSNYAELLPPAGVYDVVGAYSDYAIKRDGTVTRWGNSSFSWGNTPPDLTGVIKIVSMSFWLQALKSDGTVVIWNSDGSYQPGIIPSGLADVVDLVSGGEFSLALKSDGAVVAWDDRLESSTGPVLPSGLTNVVALAATDYILLAVKDDGTVLSWGSSPYGPGGPPTGLTNVVDVSCIAQHALALRGDGAVVSWGNQTSVPDGLTNVIAIKAGEDASAALKADGTVITWGTKAVAPPADLTKAFALYADGRGGFVLRDASTDDPPLIVTPPANHSLVEGDHFRLTVAVSGPGPYSFQWRKDGVNLTGATFATFEISEVVLANAGSYDVVVTNHAGATISPRATVTIYPAPVVTVLSARRQVVPPGEPFNLGVVATGSGPLAYQWLRNGRPVSGATASTYVVNTCTYQDSGWYVAAVTDSHGTRRSAAMFVVVAPTATEVVNWGRSDDLQILPIPSDLGPVVDLATNGLLGLAISRNGTVRAWGSSYYVPTVPTTLSDIVTVSIGGGGYALALNSNGQALNWPPSTASGAIPPPPAMATDLVAVLSGASHEAFALKSNGRVIAWNKFTGVPFADQNGPYDIVEIALGFALTAGGEVVRITSGEAIPPLIATGVKSIVSVTGSTELVVYKENGSVIRWSGYSDPVVITNESELHRIVGGGNHTLGLTTGGSVLAWGSNGYGQTTAPPSATNCFQIFAISSTSFAIRDATGFPAITTQPLSRTMGVGGAVTLTVEASGSPAPGYQWQRNGVAISGATGSTLTISDVQPGDAGRYDVVVSNGDGSVTSEAAWLGITTAATAHADFNADGWRDLVLENSASGERVIWLMNGATIAGSANLPTFTAGWHFAGTGDFNGDGKADIVLQNTQSGERVIWQMNGAGIEGSLGLPTLPLSWQFACVGDVNSDGKPDIVLQNTATNDRIIWLMNGNSITASVALPSLPMDWQICGVMDFSGDNQPDVLIQNTTTGERVIWVLNNQLAITQSLALPTFYAGWRFAGVGRYTLDNLPNILLQNTLTGERVLWSINPDGTIAGSTDLPTLPVEWSFAGPATNRAKLPALSDLTRDGQSDILVTDTGSGTRIIWAMSGNEIAGSIALPTLPVAWQFAGMGDFNADGMNDILLQNMSSGERVIWLMNGPTIGGSVSLPTLPVSWSFAATTDVDLDGQPDIVLQNNATGERVIWVMDRTTIHGSLGLPTLPTSWQIAAGGNFTADGRANLLLENTASGDRLFWALDPDGSIERSIGLAVFLGGWRFAGTGDFNSDGQPDIILQNLTTGERVIWQMNRTAIGASLGLPTLPASWTLQAAPAEPAAAIEITSPQPLIPAPSIVPTDPEFLGRNAASH